MHTATKTGPGSLKPGSKKVAYKSAKATSEFIGNKIAGKIVKPKLVPDANSRNVKEINTSIRKWNTILYLNY